MAQHERRVLWSRFDETAGAEEAAGHALAFPTTCRHPMGVTDSVVGPCKSPTASLPYAPRTLNQEPDSG
jgi:hypothetical protein